MARGLTAGRQYMDIERGTKNREQRTSFDRRNQGLRAGKSLDGTTNNVKGLAIYERVFQRLNGKMRSAMGNDPYEGE
jgi:hypothetical protein